MYDKGFRLGTEEVYKFILSYITFWFCSRGELRNMHLILGVNR